MYDEELEDALREAAYFAAVAQYEEAIESFDEVAHPKIHGGEETNPRVATVDRRKHTKYMFDDFLFFGRKPKHTSWKDSWRKAKRFGDRVDKRRVYA